MILGLAPMDGISDCAFREITKNIRDKYGNQNQYKFFLWTEFMNADGYCINPTGVIKHLLTTSNQSPIIAQIFGGNEKTLIQCFKDLEKKYSDLFYGLELNLGCPAKNVMQTGGGSAMLKDRKQTLNIIKKIRKNIKMPFSIKTRTGINNEDKTNQMKFLIQASKYVDMITIHGRTVKAGYTGEIDRDFIYKLKSKLKNSNCKIIGNGGIKNHNEIKSKIGILDGLLIGQSAIGNPRIFTSHIPNKKELREIIIKHLNLMINHELQFQKNISKSGKINILLSDQISPTPNSKTLIPHRPIIEFRKHLFQYIKGINGSKQWKQKVAKIDDYELLVKEINKFLNKNLKI